MWPVGLVLKAVLCVEVIDLDDDVAHSLKAEIGKAESRNHKSKAEMLKAPDQKQKLGKQRAEITKSKAETLKYGNAEMLTS